MADFYCPVISCKSVADIDECRSLTLLAGRQGADRQIVWVHYVEEPSYIRFIKGKELVLTTGALLHSREDYLRFIESLYHKNAAGLVISERPDGGIPFLEDIIALGDEMGLPIFSLPFRCRFEDISQRICREIFLCEQKSHQKGRAMCELFFGKPDRRSGTFTVDYDFDKKYVCAVIRVAAETVLKTPAFTDRITNYLEYCCQYYFREILFALNEQEIAMAIPLAKNENKKTVCSIISAMKKEVSAIINDTPVYCGISSVWHGKQNFYNNLVKAQFMARLCQNSKGTELDYDKSGSMKLIISLGRQNELEQYYSDSIQTLKDSDQTHGTEYVSTIFSYAKNNCNLQETASDLFIHYNTLRYRLRAIEELNGVDFKSPRDVSNLIFLWNVRQYLECIGFI